ncbi:unnamed protein product [Closterium sp. Naga37s-1]|nr:unnamed protein product [Closterium sp. Naga37s-1]CAI5536907.1 unnamed protein product [Closterium sp. Naga37s-1]
MCPKVRRGGARWDEVGRGGTRWVGRMGQLELRAKGLHVLKRVCVRAAKLSPASVKLSLLHLGLPALLPPLPVFSLYFSFHLLHSPPFLLSPPEPCVCRLGVALSRLPRLTSLTLAHNGLEALPESLSSLTALRHLDLSHNRLSSPPFHLTSALPHLQ